MKKRLFLLMAIVCMMVMTAGARKYSPYIIATDFVKADGKHDCAPGLQKIIDRNPHRTIYFPDGIYLLSHPLRTSANPDHAVHLQLANFATLQAMNTWQPDSGALVQLGAAEHFNTITRCGSNYGVEGGIFDGNGIADGIAICSGRETRINHVSIKNTQCGIHIQHGANSGSSDADICDVNIVGNDSPTSVGVLVEGYDNTFTNMRIAHIAVGLHIKSGGNSFKNIHPLYIFSSDKKYEESIGFLIEGTNNMMDYCYSDQFATGFLLRGGVQCNLTDCFTFWYSGKVPFQTSVASQGPMNSLIHGLHAFWHGDCPVVNLLTGAPGGTGSMQNTCCGQRKLSPDDVSASYLKITAH